jgi:diacylglycerol kinase (ATP)
VERLPRGSKTRSRAVSWRHLDKYRLLKSFRYAYAGIRYAWRNEPNFRIELGLALLALGLAFWLKVSLAPILIVSALVLALELLNSALEATIDLISPDFHPLAKLAKDAAAGAVLITACFALLLGLVVLGPALVSRLGFW